MLKSHKINFVIVVVVMVGGKSWVKNVIDDTTSVRANRKCSICNKKCSRDPKMFLMEQLMCKGTKNAPMSQNKVHKRPMKAMCYLLTYYGVELSCLPSMAFCGLVRSCMVVYWWRVWECMAVYGRLWPCMVVINLECSLVALYGFSMHICVVFGLTSHFLAVIYPNSFDLVRHTKAKV